MRTDRSILANYAWRSHCRELFDCRQQREDELATHTSFSVKGLQKFWINPSRLHLARLELDVVAIEWR